MLKPITIKSWIERQKAAGVYKDKPSHPHIHAHVLLLPQTRKGLRISLSNHTCPARDGVYVDMLDSLIDVYQSNIRKIVYNLDITPYNQITPEWECLIREACINTVDDFYKLKSPIPDIKVARRFGLDKFSYHLRTMSQESLQFKHNLRRQQFLQFTQEPVQTNKSTLLSTRQELSTILSTNSIRRSQHIQEIITQFKPDSKKPLHLWATSPISVCEEPFKISPNRSSILKKAIQEFEEMRRASQLQSISEISRIELRLASLKQPAIEPNWVYNLGKVAQLDVLPHQEILDTAINTGPKIPTEAITNPNQINQIPKSSPEIEVKH